VKGILERQNLPKLAPRLKELTKGGYTRAYLGGDAVRKTSTHQLVAGLLDSLGIPYREDVQVLADGGLRADFLVNGTAVFVERTVTRRQQDSLSKRRVKAVAVRRESQRSDDLDHGLRVLRVGESGRVQTIFLDDPSFNFDYAHILPKTEKCSVMHGHTSSVLVEVIGRPVDGMVVDFGAAKQIVREAVRGLDHKLFINEKYVTGMDQKSVTLKFQTVHGEFAIRAPRPTTVLLKGEATVENLAQEVLGRVAGKMPQNVTAVGVYVYEGLNKGSHLLAQIHQNEVSNRRRKR
jgi:6-pyruvoyltetrahydropterin/6-carboxytetrahydropterin synthase